MGLSDGYDLQKAESPLETKPYSIRIRCGCGWISPPDYLIYVTENIWKAYQFFLEFLYVPYFFLTFCVHGK